MKYLVSLFLLTTLFSCQEKSNYQGHGEDSVSAELLKRFAPKALSPEKISRIESMLDLRSPGSGILSPNADEIYFSWKVTGTKQVWKARKDNLFPVQMTGGQDRANLKGVTRDGKYLIISRDQKGNEYPFLYKQSTKGGELQFLAGKKKVKTNAHFLSSDGKYLYYSMNDEEPTHHRFFKINLETNKSTLVFKGMKGYPYITDHRKNGDILIGNAKGNVAREYFLFNEKTKKLTPIIGQDEKEYYSIEFAKQPGKYLVRTNKFGEFHRLYLYDGKDFKPITSKENYDVSSFNIDRQRKRILYSINQSGYGEVRALDAETYEPISLPITRERGILRVSYGSTTPDGNYTTFSIERDKSLRTTYVYNWETRELSQWVKPSNPEIDTSGFVTPSLEYYDARDGTKIPMFVNRPKKCLKELCPVVVNFHGGPESQSRPRFSPYTQLYNELGFIMVRPNIRGSRGYGKTWLDSDNGPKRLEVITDIEDASIYIKKHWTKNGKAPKVGVLGGSYGGYAVNVAMTLFAGAYDAGVAVVGMSDLVSFLNNTGAYRRHLRIPEYGDPEKDLEALKKLSPINFLDKIQDPLLVIHGATDPRVPAGEAIQIYEAMEKKGLPGELILFADEGHGVRKRKNRVLYIGHILEFFKKHLK